MKHRDVVRRSRPPVPLTRGAAGSGRAGENSLGEVAFALAWAEGAALSAAGSIEFGLKVVEQLQPLLDTETDAAGQVFTARASLS